MFHNNRKIEALMNMALAGIALKVLHPPYSKFFVQHVQRDLFWEQYIKGNRSGF